jgi:hypothetical protein
VTQSRPSSATTWTATGYMIQSSSTNYTIQAYVICV